MLHPIIEFFNPDTLAKKFDNQVHYINRRLENTWTMKPAQAIVDLTTSRAKALNKCNNIISQSK